MREAIASRPGLGTFPLEPSFFIPTSTFKSIRDALSSLNKKNQRCYQTPLRVSEKRTVPCEVFISHYDNVADRL